MNTFQWNQATQKLSGFGGEETTLTVRKTGLPFFDALRLYGAIELYVGLREDIETIDDGSQWRIIGKKRKIRVDNKPEAALSLLRRGKLKRDDKSYLRNLHDALCQNSFFVDASQFPVGTPLENPDSVLKDGVRGQSANSYKGLESGYGIGSRINLSDALLAFGGQRRIETMSRIQFLPVFEGRIDFSKVLSPIRVYHTISNVLCAQALMLLLLKTSLFAEGYENRLSAVVYNTNYDSRKRYNHSGLISISSTAIKQGSTVELAQHLLKSLEGLVSKAWKAGGKSTADTQHALNLTLWVMQPKAKHLTTMITGQEKFRYLNFFSTSTIIKEVFDMSYDEQQRYSIDHTTVKKFAKAVSSAIYYARQVDVDKDKADSNKAWYDEVTLLRSASSAKAFKEKALILIEQAKKKNPFIGTAGNQEDFDPVSLLRSIGDDRNSFEVFRDLFRMYLILESGPKTKKDNSTTDENQKGDQQ